MKREEIVSLLRSKVNWRVSAVHLDIYPMLNESLHSLLFEVLVFRKISACH